MRRVAAAALLATTVMFSACAGPKQPPRVVPAPPVTSSSTTARGPEQQLYVSLGDSYAAGYQPGTSGPGTTTRNGFAYQVPGAAAARGYALRLVNFGCSGATVESILRAPGCDQIGPDGQSYPTEPQASAAETFLRANHGRVALVTIIIGGNDVTKCALASDPTGCVTGAVRQIGTDLGTLVRDVRAAAGPEVAIVGLTYPDVLLGALATANPAAQQLATLSVAAFKVLINPALARAYASIGATFVDVTAATGAYGPLTDTTTLAPYGTIPVPAARVCELTFFCDRQDIHPTTAGYKLISDLVVQSLNAR